MYFVSYSTRSICYYVKHNDSYRPFIFLVIVKNALSSVNAERRPYLVKKNAFLYVSYYCQCYLKCCDLLIVAFHIGKAMTLHASFWYFFQLDYTVGIFFKCRKWIFPQGLDWYYFPVALDVHFDKYAKSSALENKHLSFFKCLIPLTCRCHVHVHTQQPLQWAEYVEQHSKKSNHDNKCLEPGLRHGLISSVHSPPPSHLSSTPSSASFPALSMPVLHPSFALHCPTFLISSGDGAGAMER